MESVIGGETDQSEAGKRSLHRPRQHRLANRRTSGRGGAARRAAHGRTTHWATSAYLWNPQSRAYALDCGGAKGWYHPKSGGNLGGLGNGLLVPPRDSADPCISADECKAGTSSRTP